MTFECDISDVTFSVPWNVCVCMCVGARVCVRPYIPYAYIHGTHVQNVDQKMPQFAQVCHNLFFLSICAYVCVYVCMYVCIGTVLPVGIELELELYVHTLCYIHTLK